MPFADQTIARLNQPVLARSPTTAPISSGLPTAAAASPMSVRARRSV